MQLALLGFGDGPELAGGDQAQAAARQLWAIAEAEQGKLHVGGLCNRNLTAFARELPELLAELPRS